MKPHSNSSKRNNYIFFFGFTLGTLGIISFLLKIWILEILTASLLILKPNSLIERVWSKIHGIHTDIYFFDWTNPEDFYNFSTKPKFQELGPFSFRQDIEKVDVVWNTNNTVTYGQQRHFYYEGNITNGNLTKNITSLHMVNWCVAHHVRNMNYILKSLVSAYLTSSNPYVNLTSTPKQILFDGLDDILLDMGKYFPFVSPDLPRFDKFSIIDFLTDYKRVEGIYNMGIGIDRDFEVYNWNFNNKIQHLNGSCAKVHGSAGELYSKNAISKEYIGIFVSVLCRYLRLEFEDEVMVNGVKGYKYSAGDMLLDNGTLIPGNECYCDGDCIPRGMVNLTSCRFGAPMFASLPHYYGADPMYLDAVEGLHPREDKHETYVVVEPITGIILNASIRFQINIRIHSIEDISLYENARDLFFPFVWMEQRSTLPDDIFSTLRILLMFPDLLIGIGCGLIILGLAIICIPFKPFFKKLFGQERNILTLQEEMPLRPGDSIIKANIT